MTQVCYRLRNLQRNCCALDSFDAMVAAVLLASLAESIASPELRGRTLSAHLELQVLVRQIPILATLAPELFLLIEQYCKHWAYPSPSERVEIVFFGGDAHG